MAEHEDIFLTKRGNWSGARFKYTIKLVKHIRPKNIFQKTKTQFTKTTDPRSENQWNKIMDAGGQTGEKYFQYLVNQNIMIPSGTRTNGNRSFDLYKVNLDKLACEIENSNMSEDVFEASKFIVNQCVPNRKVRRDY